MSDAASVNIPETRHNHALVPGIDNAVNQANPGKSGQS